MKPLVHDPNKKWDAESDQAKSDSFHPPEPSRRVKCQHCGKQFQSSEMFWGTKAEVRTYGPIWWCPTPKCDGAGYGFDIFDAETLQ